MNHISIEGMDGVGKTTLCRGLSKDLGYEFIEKPLHYLFDRSEDEFTEYIRIRDRVNADPNRLFTSWFYALGTIYMYAKFKEDNIVTDRHILSNWAWSGTEESKDVYDFLLNHIGKPKYTVILYASPSAIEERMKSRNNDDADLQKIKMSNDIYRKMVQFAKKHRFTTLLLDSTGLESGEALRIVERWMEGQPEDGSFQMISSPKKGGEKSGSDLYKFLKTI